MHTSTNAQFTALCTQQVQNTLLQYIRKNMRNALHRRVGAADILQNALMQAYKRFSYYLRNAHNMQFLQFVKCIVRDCILTAQRVHTAAKRSVIRTQSINASTYAGCVHATQLAQIIKTEQIALLFAKASTLSTQYAQIITLVHKQSLTLAQAAAHLQITHSCACMRYKRALQQLRAIAA